MKLHSRQKTGCNAFRSFHCWSLPDHPRDKDMKLHSRQKTGCKAFRSFHCWSQPRPPKRQRCEAPLSVKKQVATRFGRFIVGLYPDHPRDKGVKLHSRQKTGCNAFRSFHCWSLPGPPKRQRCEAPLSSKNRLQRVSVVSLLVSTRTTQETKV